MKYPRTWHCAICNLEVPCRVIRAWPGMPFLVSFSIQICRRAKVGRRKLIRCKSLPVCPGCLDKALTADLRGQLSRPGAQLAGAMLGTIRDCYNSSDRAA